MSSVSRAKRHFHVGYFTSPGEFYYSSQLPRVEPGLLQPGPQRTASAVPGGLHLPGQCPIPMGTPSIYIGLHLVGSGGVAAGCPCADKRNTEACGEERKFRGFLSKAKGKGKGAFFVAHYHEFPY